MWTGRWCGCWACAGRCSSSRRISCRSCRRRARTRSRCGSAAGMCSCWRRAAWLPGGLTRPPAPAARAGLLRRWLAASGPATVDDLRWWTGLTAGQVKAALAQIPRTEVDLDGTPGFVLAGDEDPVPEVAPWAALLPALDPTVMGWQDRRWFLGGHGQALTDRSGNIGPTVWWDGRVIGGWAQRADGRIVVRLLEDAGADAVAAAEDEAERLRGWIGSVRVTPRFRTPLER